MNKLTKESLYLNDDNKETISKIVVNNKIYKNNKVNE